MEMPWAGATATPSLRGVKLVRTFGDGATRRAALQEVSIDLFPGQIVLLMGPSGSGKSTLLAILSGLLGYTYMAFNMIMFRNKWPLDTIKRGYVHPLHPLPAIVLLLLCAVTYFAVFLGYGTQLVAMMVFFAVASLWFHFHRYQFVKRGDQFTMQWPRPKGY